MAFEPFDLSGRVVLVTGGNGGIGLGFARGVAAAGAEVCLWGTNAEKNAAAAAALEPFGTRVTSQVVDVSSEAAVEDAFAAALDAHGRVDGCFANAGVGGRGVPFEEMPLEDWRRVFGVNLDGAFFTFRAAARHMKARADAGDPFGRLVGTASLAAISGPPRGEHYAATKGGLVSMMRSLAVEYARHGVTAHAVLPGWVETAMTEQSFANPKFAENVGKRIPMRRWGTPEDFTGIAVYIMSTASSWHTAETFLIDGGYAVY